MQRTTWLVCKRYNCNKDLRNLICKLVLRNEIVRWREMHKIGFAFVKTDVSCFVEPVDAIDEEDPQDRDLQLQGVRAKLYLSKPPIKVWKRLHK